MADNYLQFSLFIDIPDKCIEWAKVLLEGAKNYEELTEFRRKQVEVVFDFRPFTLARWELEFQWDFVEGLLSRGLIIFADEYGNPEHVSQFLMALLKHPACTQKKYGFEYAWTCSKMRPDGFGGGACFVYIDEETDEAKTEWMTTHGWLREKMRS